MTAIEVSCDASGEDGWNCDVMLAEAGREISRHRIRVGTTDLARLAPGASTPDGLVKASFAFLLERESPHSILRSFDLTEIGRYFPEYEREIRQSSG
jgi:hypothetical protein